MDESEIAAGLLLAEKNYPDPKILGVFPTLRPALSRQSSDPPTCVVCLEQMDGVCPNTLTTACNHSFHITVS